MPTLTKITALKLKMKHNRLEKETHEVLDKGTLYCDH